MDENKSNNNNPSFSQSATNNQNVTQVQTTGDVAINQKNNADIASVLTLLSKIQEITRSADADADIKSKIESDIKILGTQIQKPAPSKSIVIDSLHNIANIAKDVTAINGVVPLAMQAIEMIKNIID